MNLKKRKVGSKMEIKIKKSKNPEEPFYVFYFEDKNEADYYIQLLESNDVSKLWGPIFREKLTDKFKTAESKYSVLIFQNELLRLVSDLFTMFAISPSVSYLKEFKKEFERLNREAIKFKMDLNKAEQKLKVLENLPGKK